MEKRALTRLSAAAAATVLVAVGGWFGYQHYERSAQLSAATPHVKLASVYATTVLQTVQRGDVTFKEAFEKVDTAVSEMDKAAVQLRTAAKDADAPINKAALDYLATSQGAVRALGQVTRKALATSLAMDRMRATDLDFGSSVYMREANMKRAQQNVDDAKKAVGEGVDAAVAAHKALVALEEAQPGIKAMFGEGAAVDGATLTKLKEAMGVAAKEKAP